MAKASSRERVWIYAPFSGVRLVERRGVLIVSGSWARRWVLAVTGILPFALGVVLLYASILGLVRGESLIGDGKTPRWVTELGAIGLGIFLLTFRRGLRIDLGKSELALWWRAAFVGPATLLPLQDFATLERVATGIGCEARFVGPRRSVCYMLSRNAVKADRLLGEISSFTGLPIAAPEAD